MLNFCHILPKILTIKCKYIYINKNEYKFIVIYVCYLYILPNNGKNNSCIWDNNNFLSCSIEKSSLPKYF